MNYKRHENTFGTKLGRCGVTGKVIFRTEGAAKKRIKEILNENTNRANDYLRAFPCVRCGYWHLTSKPNDRFYRQLQIEGQKQILRDEKSKAFNKLATSMDYAIQH